MIGIAPGDPLLALWVRRKILSFLDIPFEDAGAAIEPLTGEEAPQYRLLARIRERPLFGGHRILWISRAERSPEIDPAILLEKNRSTSTVLLLEAQDKLLASWSKIIPAYSLALPTKPADRENWLHFLAERHGLTLSREALEPLLTTYEGAPGPVDQLFLEIKKAGEGPSVTGQLLGKHGVESHYKTVFELLKGLESGEKRFFGEWRRFLENGQSPFGLISLLHRQWKLYRIAKGALKEGASDRAAASAVASVGGVQPFVAESVVRAAKRLPADGLARGIDALAEADRLLKSGVAQDLVMDRLSATLAILFGRDYGRKSSRT